MERCCKRGADLCAGCSSMVHFSDFRPKRYTDCALFCASQSPLWRKVHHDPSLRGVCARMRYLRFDRCRVPSLGVLPLPFRFPIHFAIAPNNAPPSSNHSPFSILPPLRPFPALRNYRKPLVNLFHDWLRAAVPCNQKSAISRGNAAPDLVSIFSYAPSMDAWGS